MSDKPKRIQRKRTKGWRMPENTVYVGRGSKWGNPFRVSKDYPSLNPYICKTPQDAVWKFKNQIKLFELDHPKCVLKFNLTDLANLKGRDVACWCRLDQVCHGDVLLELANKEINERSNQIYQNQKSQRYNDPALWR